MPNKIKAIGNFYLKIETSSVVDVQVEKMMNTRIIKKASSES
jgi:hypothetical protein